MERGVSGLAENPDGSRQQGRRWAFWTAAVFLASIALYPLSRTNYLFFHTLVELSSVAVSATVFSIGWNARRIARNDSFALLASSYLVVAGLDLLHAMAYKGMGVFPGAGVDPPTQFWVAARLVEGVSYLLAAILLGRKSRCESCCLLKLYLAVGVLLTLSILPWRIFPACLVEGVGLTPFKIAAEYTVCVLLLASGILFWQRRGRTDRQLLSLLLVAIGLTISSELAFTLYQDVYGFTNFFGHILKLASVVAIYRVYVLGSLQEPYQTLFHDLAESHQALDRELVQRCQTEAELRAANQELDAFVRTASHDLRTPLTVIISGAELLQQALAGQLQKDHLDVLGHIEQQGYRMSGLLKDMMTLARVGFVDHPAETVHPALVASQVVEDLHHEIREHSCRVEIGDIPPLEAHPSLIYQTLLNLVANAVRYGVGPVRTVRIGGEHSDDRFRLFVSDHGPGIPAEERERIFEVFYRLHDKETQGTGIGLAIVQKIARYYGGRAYVEETPGGGATFWVEFAANPA